MFPKYTKPIKLAVFLEQKIQIGGGHQQALNSILFVNSLSKDICDPSFIITDKENIKILSNYGINSIYLKISIFRRVIMSLKRRIYIPSSMQWIRNLLGRSYVECFLDKLNTELIYFTSPSSLPKYLSKYNFIYTVWDLSHRDEVEFPEVRENFVFERRDELNKDIFPKSMAILVDSKVGAENLVRRYGVDKNRVLVMPFSPAENVVFTDKDYEKNFIDIKNKYNIKFDYLFYPAQFWPHKNHIYILKALKTLQEKYNIKIGAIFSGSDKGNMQYIKDSVCEFELSEQVVFTGFVSNTEMRYLYRQSFALTMPSYFGPTNLPPLEALNLGVPIIYGDINGAREQLHDAAIFLDLSNYHSLCDAVISLKNDNVRNNFIEKGFNQLEYINNKRNKAEDEFKKVFLKFNNRRDCWSSRL
jgi:glycosyltransferase involved in cell wall biosynthesis